MERWIAYASTLAGHKGVSEQSRKAYAGIMVATLSRALEACPENMGSPSLHIAFFKAASTIWKPAKLLARWQQVLRGDPQFMFPDVATLWLAHLDYRESTGTVDDAWTAYRECLRELGHRAGPEDPLEDYQIYVILRFCLFIRRAGTYSPHRKC